MARIGSMIHLSIYAGKRYLEVPKSEKQNRVTQIETNLAIEYDPKWI